MLCRACATEKTLGEFYSGVPSRCKDCHKAAMKIRRLTDPSVREYDRKRAKTPERKAAAREITIRWRAEHPIAYLAQTAIGNALRDGKILKQPCALCGTDRNVHAHHQDYSKPLDVKWLCAKCHHRVHATFPELGGHFQAAE